MPDRFPVGIPLELAWTRRVLCAVEVIDAVTLEPVRTGIEVRALGLKRKPTVNFSGYHVWLEEKGAQPQRIFIDARDSRFANAESEPPVPPEKSVRIELAPRFAYPFPPGATALRGTLRVSRFGQPEAVAGASVRLQWSGGTDWIDAPTVVTSEKRGDFAAPLRLAPTAEPRVGTRGLAVRLRVERDGVQRTTDEFALPPGKVTPAPQPFIWDDLNP